MSIMENTVKEGFVHSIKVPTQYKRTASVLKAALERKKSLRSLIFQEEHARKPGMQAILKRYSDNRTAIDSAIQASKILQKNPRLCPVLCKVLVTELIFGRKELKGESKPVQTVQKYHKKLLKALGGEPLAELRITAQKPRYVRVNTNLLTMPQAIELVQSEGFHEKKCPPFEAYNDYLNAITSLDEAEYLLDIHVENLLVFSPKLKQFWACHKLVNERKFLLQDKATCLIAGVLQPPAGSVVLDMCAAPGMKTIHISNVMKKQGTIYAIEKCADRYQLLCNMAEAAGCGNVVKCVEADVLTIDDKSFPNVEYILLDPPCSGSGMQNRMSLDPDEKNPDRLQKLAGLQIKMLSHAMTAFPSVKRICYSTCSLYEEENEQVVEKCVHLNPQFKLLSGKKALRSNWAQTGNAEYKKIGKNCIYTRPNKDFTDGIFIAIFERQNCK